MTMKLRCDGCGRELVLPYPYYVSDLYEVDPNCRNTDGQPLHKIIRKRLLCFSCYHEKFADVGSVGE